ncbi:hypothetical protein FPV21_07465 [Carnobacterium sp. PL12RED10]|uniref:hypothetical protein n=1 Tax=Carnobacterium sp. PL12RED10 TaxID=2592351 RepID=UPI0013F90E85|nr:hypothetical protein [Carnobacterium sp. PL12RED10]KAF3299338.1 hypothetical protein FPV21_07465 [Carnobacterium sp. PL12RED10]
MIEKEMKKELEKRIDLLTDRIKILNSDPIIESLIRGELIGINYALTLLSYLSDGS